MRAGYILVGLLCLLAAAGFGLNTTVYLHGGQSAPNIAAAGAACGLAIAGGLCFVASAVGQTDRRRAYRDDPED